jgi:hypothetical protein
MMSALAGGVFGLLALVGMGATMFGAFAAIAGLATGLILSPVLVWALWVPPRVLGTFVIILPTAALSYSAGCLTGLRSDGGNPPLCALLAGAAYVGSGLAFGHWARKRRKADPSTRPLCPKCGYSLRGLPLESICPECGRR